MTPAEMEARILDLTARLAALEAAVQRTAAYQGVAHLLKDQNP